jgi:hypothetical protein
MTINEIFLNKEISTQTYIICLDNNINTLTELKEFHSIYGTFENLINCNDKSNSELLNIVIKYYDFVSNSVSKFDQYSNFDLYYSVKNFTKDQIDDLNIVLSNNFLKLSIRSANAINKFFSGSIDVDSFLVKVLQNNDFNSNVLNEMNNVGRKSIPEIKAFFSEIKNSIILINENIKEDQSIKFDSKPNNFHSKIYEVNDFKIQIINDYVSLITNQLSVRSKNALNSFLENKIDIRNIYEKILSKLNFDFNSIDNVGRRSYEELDLFLNKIKDFLIDINEINDDTALDQLKYNLFFKNEFDGIEIPNEIISKKTIFSLIQFTIDNRLVFGFNETYILENGINIYENSVLYDLNELSENLSLTKERCRQIRVKIINELESKFTFLANFEQNIFIKYKIDFNDPLIIITNEIASNVNSIDGTNFSKCFITLITSFFYKSEFELLGNVDDLLILKDFSQRTRHNWRGLYLVSKTLKQNFEFEKFVEDVERRNFELINETYSLNFKNYLSDFLISEDLDYLEILFDVCEKILNEEFNIHLNSDHNIVFERRKQKALHDYAFEALEILGKPSHIDDINIQLKKLKPDYNNVLTSSTLKREYGFAPFGRSSVFGLKKWDKENNNIKSGTIRNIVEELLLKSDNPMHINDIFNYVILYRPSVNHKSLITNIIISQQFTKYPNNYIGLISKVYREEYLNFKQINGTFFSISNLKKFNNFSIKEVVQYFKTKHGYDEKQVEFILNEKIIKGELSKTNQGKIIIEKFKSNELRDYVLEISNEVIKGTDEFHISIKNLINQNKIIDSIQLCFEKYNSHFVDLNFKDYFVIINEIKKQIS